MKKLCILATLSVLSAPVWAGDVEGGLPASLTWSQRVELAPSVSGVVESVWVEAGQTVAAGALLLRLNPALYQARSQEAQAERDRLAVESQDAEADFNRAKELYARTVSSTTEFDAARLRHARVTQALAGAEARLAAANRQLSETEIRAPFAARVLERRAEPGMAAPANCQPPVLLVIARADERIARATVSAGQAARIHWGDRLTVDVDGKPMAATVRGLTALPDGAYRVDAALQTTLLPGQGAISMRLR
jgi:RND family efflux transporter MFP subunit